jgi:uncharacterized protein (TIGR02453 family)
MKTTFPGFPREGIAFLRNLANNNDREWFTPRKETYEAQVRQPMFALLDAVQHEMARFAPAYLGDPAKALYRIYRDTRFSKDKTPYKTHAGALLWHNSTQKNEGASFYFAISPKSLDIAGGLYSPDPQGLLAVRHHIAEDPAAFRATFEGRKVKKLMGDLQGEALTRVPKGFDPASPAADLLRQKQLILFCQLPVETAMAPKVVSEIVTRFEAMLPFVAFLNAPLVEQKLKQRRDREFLR